MYNIKVQQAPAESEDEQEADDYEDDEASTELIYASHTFHTTENAQQPWLHWPGRNCVQRIPRTEPSSSSTR